MSLTAHQITALRREFPDVRIDGNIIRTGIWQLQHVNGQLTLPSARRLDDPHIDGSDEAMEVWLRMREALGC